MKRKGGEEADSLVSHGGAAGTGTNSTSVVSTMISNVAGAVSMNFKNDPTGNIGELMKTKKEQIEQILDVMRGNLELKAQFAHLPPAVLEAVCASFEAKTLPCASQIIQQGHLASLMFIVRSGECAAIEQSPPAARSVGHIVRRFIAGQSFGAHTLARPVRCPFIVQVTSPTASLWVLEGSLYSAIVGSDLAAKQIHSHTKSTMVSGKDPLAVIDHLLDGESDEASVGLILEINPLSDLVQIAGVLPGESADISRQLVPGDVILAIDGKRGLSKQQMELALLGPQGSAVTLHLLRADGIESMVPLMRAMPGYFQSPAYTKLLDQVQSSAPEVVRQAVSASLAQIQTTTAPSSTLQPSSVLVSAKQLDVGPSFDEHGPIVMPVPLPLTSPLPPVPSSSVVEVLDTTEAHRRAQSLLSSSSSSSSFPPPPSSAASNDAAAQATASILSSIDASQHAPNRQWLAAEDDGKAGVGIVVENDPVTHAVYVHEIIRDAGAHRSGNVDVGDMIVAIDGIQIDGLPSTLFKLIRGPAGTFINVELRKHQTKEKRIVRLQRGPPEYFDSKHHYQALRSDDLVRNEIGVLQAKMVRFTKEHGLYRTKIEQVQQLVQQQHDDFQAWSQPLVERNEKAKHNVRLLEGEWQAKHETLQSLQVENRERRREIARLMEELEREERKYAGTLEPEQRKERPVSWNEPSTWGKLFAA